MNKAEEKKQKIVELVRKQIIQEYEKIKNVFNQKLKKIYQRIKDYLINNFKDKRISLWNKEVESIFKVLSVESLAYRINQFYKENNQNYKEQYEDSNYDELFVSLKKRKINKIIEDLKTYNLEGSKNLIDDIEEFCVKNKEINNNIRLANSLKI